MLRYMIKIMLGSIPHKKILFLIYLLEDEQELSLGMLICLWSICTSILHYAFISTFIALWVVITHYISILMAIFYTILGTNILIQCPVPVPVCCMFYVSQKYPYQTESKRDKNGRRLFLEYSENMGRKIHARRCPREARGRWARPWPSWAPCKAVDALLRPQES